MAVVAIQDIKSQLEPDKCLLGLDLGSKTIGVAVSDPALIVASPLQTIRRIKFTKDAEALFAIIEERHVGGLILGLPIEMDGTEGPRCQSTRQFGANLLEKSDILIAFWDERMSTAAIERFLVDEADMTRKRRSQVVDKMAAAYILQAALDSIGR